MKKNRILIFLAFICIIQLAVPLSIMGMKEIATENGLQGKMKVEAVFYSALSETLDFELSRYAEKDGSSGSYIPVYLDENGFIKGKSRTFIKPSGSYIDLEKFKAMYMYYEFEKSRLNFIIPEEELNRLTLNRMSDLNYDNFYVTVSIYNGEIIFKELWEGDRKLVELR